MREKEIEKVLVKRTEDAGGVAYKWSSPNCRGVPDRLCFFPQGKVFAVEVKAPGKRPTRLQQYHHGRLRQLGIDVLVIDSIEGVERFINGI